ALAKRKFQVLFAGPIQEAQPLRTQIADSLACCFSRARPQDGLALRRWSFFEMTKHRLPPEENVPGGPGYTWGADRVVLGLGPVRSPPAFGGLADVQTFICGPPHALRCRQSL